MIGQVSQTFNEFSGVCGEESPDQGFIFKIAPENGSIETYTSYTEFIFKIRGLYRSRDCAVQLTINGKFQSPWIRVRANDVYVVALNPAKEPWSSNQWKQIPERASSYTNITDQFIFDLETTKTTLKSVKEWSEGKQRRELISKNVAILAFIISEAVRFDVIFTIVDIWLSKRILGIGRPINRIFWYVLKLLLLDWSAMGQTVGISMETSRNYCKEQGEKQDISDNKKQQWKQIERFHEVIS